MNLIYLALKNISGSAFRSWIVVLCAAVMAGFAVSATIVIGGAQKSLQLALDRLGADIIVVPVGTERRIENALLMGDPTVAWMPASVTQKVAEIGGVTAVSPQLFLSTLRGATCCSVPEMFLIAYDPETDFTLRPWLEEHHRERLELGESVGGAFVYLPAGDDLIYVYGYGLDLKGNLAQTGTGIDQSMFFTFDTAREISRLSEFQAEKIMEIPADSISAVLVKVDLKADPEEIVRQIQSSILGVTPIRTTNLFRTQRSHILGLMNSVMVLLGIIWILSIALIAMIFSMAVNERKREIGVLRALGSTRWNTLRSLLLEGIVLGMAGSVGGVALFTLTIYLFRNMIIQIMETPFLFPPLLSLLWLTLGALGVTLLSVILAALFPALRISLMDPAYAMRE